MVILSATVTDQVGCHSLSWLCFSIIVRPNHARLTEPKIVLELFPFKFFCTILNINHINQMLFREVKYHSIITAINPLMVDRSKRVSVAFRPATATSNTEKPVLYISYHGISGNHISPFALACRLPSVNGTKEASSTTSSPCHVLYLFKLPEATEWLVAKNTKGWYCRNHGSSVILWVPIYSHTWCISYICHTTVHSSFGMVRYMSLMLRTAQCLVQIQDKYGESFMTVAGCGAGA